MVSLDLPEGAATLTLPDNRNVAVFAVTVAENPIDDVELASRLFIRPDEQFCSAPAGPERPRFVRSGRGRERLACVPLRPDPDDGQAGPSARAIRSPAASR